MTDEELLELDPRKLTEDEARIICMELLQEDLPADKSGMIRNGILSFILLVVWVLVGIDTIVGYGIMGVAGMFLIRFFDKLYVFLHKKYWLKKCEKDAYRGGYADFVMKCQDHVGKRMYH